MRSYLDLVPMSFKLDNTKIFFNSDVQTDKIIAKDWSDYVVSYLDSQEKF